MPASRSGKFVFWENFGDPKIYWCIQKALPQAFVWYYCLFTQPIRLMAFGACDVGVSGVATEGVIYAIRHDVARNVRGGRANSTARCICIGLSLNDE